MIANNYILAFLLTIEKCVKIFFFFQAKEDENQNNIIVKK
jgi:hypothetical protein